MKKQQKSIRALLDEIKTKINENTLYPRDFDALKAIAIDELQAGHSLRVRHSFTWGNKNYQIGDVFEVPKEYLWARVSTEVGAGSLVPEAYWKPSQIRAKLQQALTDLIESKDTALQLLRGKIGVLNTQKADLLSKVAAIQEEMNPLISQAQKDENYLRTLMQTVLDDGDLTPYYEERKKQEEARSEEEAKKRYMDHVDRLKGKPVETITLTKDSK